MGTVCCYFASLAIVEPRKARSTADWRELRRALSASSELCWSIAVYGLLFGLLRAVFWSYSEYFDEAKSSMSVGNALALGSILAAMSSGAAAHIRRLLCLRALIGVGGGLLSLSLLCMSSFVGSWCFVWVFVHQIIRGSTMSTLSAHLQHAASGKAEGVRAALASTREMIFLVNYLVVVIALRTISSDLGIGNALFYVGMYSAVGALALVLVARKIRLH